jgi:hypothetical protein
MPRGRPTNNRNAGTPDTAAKLGFEAKLWQAADALRNTWMRPSTSTSYSA